VGKTGSRWALAALLVLVATPAAAATITTYSNETAFYGAAGPEGLLRENFDGFDAGTPITTLQGLTFSSPNEGLEGFQPIETYDATGFTSSSPMIAIGGYVPSSATVPQVMRIAFDDPVLAFGAYIIAYHPDATAGTLTLHFIDETTATVPLVNTSESESTPVFLGVTSDTPIFLVTFTSGFEAGAFEEFGLDDVIWLDEEPPVCTSQTAFGEFFFGIAGSATDNVGIESVTLIPGSTNLTLTVNPDFDPGDDSVSFGLTSPDPEMPASGGALVTDVSGLTCTVGADFTPTPEGPVEDLVLCSGDGILFQVTGTSDFEGTTICSSNLPPPGGTTFPPGYEPSPPEDPWPCRELTIESPIAGSTEMVYKKDGTFDPRLRLLYSHFDGTSFPPYTDITQTVTEIATVIPDPTRLKGGGLWSTVRVTCAIQSELCNGLDDDGDLLVDEGLPVGAPAVDADLDTYALCPAVGDEGDCNDQIASIHPGAVETCNGLDDDCDAEVDDGNPGGGADCVVAGQMGACAEGTITCVNSDLVCEPAVEPSTEVCDAVDNDCDGEVDENYVFGGYLPPVNPDGSSIFRRRSTIPLKFQLTDCSGAVVSDAVATVTVFFYSGGILGSELESTTSSGNANTDNLYRYDATSQQYIYNLSGMTLTSGNTYLVRTMLDDGSTHDVLISIR
jgi:hypothetical protein